MVINGINYELKFSVGAVVEISSMCPDGLINNFGRLFEGSTAQILENTAKVAVAMAKHAGNANPLKLEDVLTLSFAEFKELQAEIVNARNRDCKTEIAPVPAKKKPKGEGSAQS